MKKLLYALVLLPVLTYAQVAQTTLQQGSGVINSPTIGNAGIGIQWTEGLSWEQVKQKAKEENKYIFLDCFTTWCGPCKKMDREVYGSDTVGNYFNDRFISVKVQMDKTEKDNAFVQSWYNDAGAINKEYRIEGYPSIIFFSPQGEIVDKQMGYKPVSGLLSIAQSAIQPGKVYVDSYAAYARLVAEYKLGIKHYDSMSYMIKAAGKLGEREFEKQLLNDHTDYVTKLPPEQRYTKENILLWAGYILRSEGPRFQFFYKDGDMIDKVMNKKGYAQRVVDKTIDDEIIQPFYKKQPTGNLMLPHMIKHGEVDYSDADWSELYKEIRKKFGKIYAERIVFTARINWYDMHNNMKLYIKYYIKKIQKETKDSLKRETQGGINHFGWTCFLRVTDIDQLKKVIPWIEKVVKKYPNVTMLDTYANLLYKSGNKQEAISWEERAMLMEKNERNKEGYRSVIEKMKKGEPTYVNQGAFWNKGGVKMVGVDLYFNGIDILSPLYPIIL
jgi:thioredoxin-related protein